MRFLVPNHRLSRYISQQGYLKRFLFTLMLVLAIAYTLSCLGLYFRQEQILFQPNKHISPVSPQDFQLTPHNIWIDVPNSPEQIHSWWFDAPNSVHPIVAIPHEPVNILSTPKTMLYFCGRGGSKTHYNNLARIKGFQQLGFSVLAIDYRGYGLSKGQLPNEARLYEDSQAAWDYLLQHRQLIPQDIVIYGESLGGAVAINLAVEQPHTAGLIVQSSFTSMSAQVRQFRPLLSIFPLDLILHQRFASIKKVGQLSMPVLFLHGTADTIVNSAMSGQLYNATPEPKTLFYIPGAKHLRLYQPGQNSYLLAIKNFILDIETQNN